MLPGFSSVHYLCLAAYIAVDLWRMQINVRVFPNRLLESKNGRRVCIPTHIHMYKYVNKVVTTVHHKSQKQ